VVMSEVVMMLAEVIGDAEIKRKIERYMDT
jgi:hypothetical protein